MMSVSLIDVTYSTNPFIISQSFSYYLLMNYYSYTLLVTVLSSERVTLSHRL